MSNDDNKPMGRRRFFRAGLAELLKPLGNAIAPLEQIAHELGKLEDPLHRAAHQPYVPATPYRPSNPVAYNPAASSATEADEREHWLRPPGARPEQEFTNICSRCGNCVHACPVQAIHIDHSLRLAGGVPYIDPDSSACVMCDELSCMTQCPSSALMLVPREDIDLGTAAWNDSLCLRTTVGEQCSMCVDHCPVGTLALEVIDNRIVVHEDHCTGCGSCQNNCPTHPKSIVVIPKSKRDAVAGD